jgi:release factor glutamine methyltransferase
MTLREALTRATDQLYQNPALRPDALPDAALLLRHALGISKATLVANPDRTITLDQQAAYQAIILRRLTNEPIQYIVGSSEFYGLDFHLTPAVLIPRPATEILVEAVLSELTPEAAASPAPLRIADIGTGSGIIAITLAHHLPNAHFTAVDLSTTALEVAARNAARHNLTSRIRFFQSDLLSNLPPNEPPYDAIVANLPYIPSADLTTLHPQVRDHEPHLALFAGPDGLDLYRQFLPQARAALKPNGLFGLEMGYSHAPAMAALLADWTSLRIVDDLEQIPRAALARKPSP